MVILDKASPSRGGGGTPSKSSSPQTPPPVNDVVFVIEGTALCGAYIHELKTTYVYPTLECLNVDRFEERESGSDGNFNLYGLVVFHSSDILPGKMTEAYGPISTPHNLLSVVERIHFSGGLDGFSHVGEGLASALQCLQDLQAVRSNPDVQTAKHIILICNCKPYGLPVLEAVGETGLYRGKTADMLAMSMAERNIHLSIFSPRKIPALINLFERAGGESSTQKTYARDPRHLVLLNGFQLQERPITPPPPKPPGEPAVSAAISTSSQNPQLVPTPPVPLISQPTPPTPTLTSQGQGQMPISSTAQQNQVPSSTMTHNQLAPQPAAPTPPQITAISTSQPPQPTAFSAPQTAPSNPNIVGAGLFNPPQAIAAQRLRALRPGMNQQNQMGITINQQNTISNQGQGLVKPMGGPGQQMNPQLSQQLTQQQQVNVNPSQQQLSQPQTATTTMAQQMQTQQQPNANVMVNPNFMNQQQQPQQIQQQQIQNPVMSTPSQAQIGQMGQPGMQQQTPISMPQQMAQGQMQQGNINIPIQMAQGQQMGFMNQQQLQQSSSIQGTPNQMPIQSGAASNPQMQQIPNPNMQQQLSQQRWGGPMGPQQSQLQNQAQLQQIRMQQLQQQQQQQQILMGNQQNQQPNQSQGVSPQGQPGSAMQQQLQQQPSNSTLIAQLQNPPQTSQQVNIAGGPAAQMVQLPTGGQGNQSQKERQIVWSGSLEWHEKQKGPPEGQKIPRQVPCTVAANVINGEPEVKGDGWPQKLIMQLIPKAIVGSLGGTYFRDVKTVLFALSQCEALTSLTRVLDSGFAGCVHFTGAGMQQPSCAIKVLILLYSKERNAYLGFIPNDQTGFVDRIRKVIQQQKTQQAVMRQGFPPGGMPGGPGPQQQGSMGQPQPTASMPLGTQNVGQMPTLAQQLGQQPQQVMGNPVLAQQLNQNQPQQPQAQQMQQMNPQLQQGSIPPPPQQQQQQQQPPPQQQQTQQQQPYSNVVDSTSAAAELHAEIDRQQNLLKIQQLQQTLQQAQQRELQYQQQCHPVPGQMGGNTMQQSNQQQQQQQPMQQQMQQGQQIQGIPRQMMAPQNAGQMRMMRPATVAQGNPGLRHLLQQQAPPPNYRMQSMQVQQGMQRMPGQPGTQQVSQQMTGGPMGQGQQGGQNQFQDVGILDLLNN